MLQAQGHVFTPARTQMQCWVTYLSVGDFKQIGNICNDICNPRKVMLMQKQTETKAFQNTCSAVWKRKVGDGGVGAPLTNKTDCGECQGEMKSGGLLRSGPLCQGEQPFPVDLNLHSDL